MVTQRSNAGADPAGVEYRGTTQLVRAAALNNLPGVRRLLALGARADLCDEGGYSPLWWATHLGLEHVAEALLDGDTSRPGSGAFVDLADFRRVTPLMDACYQGHVGIVRLLLSRGASLALRTVEGGSALTSSVQRDRADVLELLSAAPGFADALTARDNKGLTPLALALRLGHAASAAKLREFGAKN